MQSAKKLLGLTCILVLLAVAALGCQVSGKSEAQETALLVGGSTTVLPVTKALAEEFMKHGSGVAVSHDGGGSTAGLIAVKRGAIDIAAMSRDLKRSEVDSYTKTYLIGKDCLAIVVHPANPVSNLNTDQVADIFKGVITNWSTVGGKNQPIKLVNRKQGSTTRKGAEELLLHNAEFSKNALLTESAHEMARAIASRPDAIGYLALKDLRPETKALSINHVAINKATVLSGRYPLVRPFYYVVWDQPSAAAVNFINFAKSRSGQDLIAKEGIIAVY